MIHNAQTEARACALFVVPTKPVNEQNSLENLTLSCVKQDGR